MRTSGVLGVLVCLVMVAGLGLGGCASGGPRAVSITVTPDAELEGSPFVVHMIGVSGNEVREESWTVEKTGQHFSGGGEALEKSGRLVKMSFTGEGGSQTLASTDAVWEKWLKKDAPVTHVVVLSNSVLSGTSAGVDPRVEVVDLSAERSKEGVRLRVGKDGLGPERDESEGARGGGKAE